ncbi:pentapeptide repeat-containing protein [Campylobacter sp. 2457A]|uniref:pentapeptide repeat-containing protein n=1 Tax=Campylobacter sp. 2457A TaxID=2735784 RepID=UPI00301E3763|nr:pentapeptide repeat-containing protein [Campylobacter sp. 2457A]
MGSENFIENLKRYGILARDAKRFKKWKTRIFISNAAIEEVDFKTLQEEGIKKLYVYDCKISNIKFSNQNDLRIYFVKCNFLDQVIASKCNFEKEANFKKTIFQDKVIFTGATFQKEASFNETTFQKEASFSNCEFKDKANFKRFTSVALSPKDGNYNELNILFENCIFNKRADFHNSKIANGIYFTDNRDYSESNILFEDCIFNKRADFHNSKIANSIYFTDSHFKDYADFHACGFEKNTCFYRVKFEKVPNFSACYFKEQKAVNLINVDIDKLNFKSVENYIKDNYKDEINKDEKSIFKIENKYKLKCAKDCKDSFRVIKDVLTNQNNTLEAQEWHKLELYTKEKELEILLGEDEKGKSKRKIKKISFRKNIIEDIIASIGCFIIYFLIFMSKLTFNFFLALFKIRCKTIYKIVKFVLSYVFKCFLVFFKILAKTIYKIIQIILFCIFNIKSIDRIIKLEFLKYKRKISRFGKRMTDFTLWFDCVLLHIYRNTSDHHTNFLKILNFTILMISLYGAINCFFLKTVNYFSSLENWIILCISYCISVLLFIFLISLKQKFIFIAFILVFIIEGIFTIGVLTFLSSVYIPTFYFMIYFLGIFIFYILFTFKIELFVFILRLLAYVVLVIVLFEKPQLINPFIDVFSSGKIYESKLEKKLNDFNTSAILNLAKISQKDFNLSMDYKDISFTELNSAKKIIIDNKENITILQDEKLKIAKEFLGDKYEQILQTINQDEIMQKTIKSTSILYGIILLLCIFSLQKTARKNSIVPS